jgi:hypothetical protein
MVLANRTTGALFGCLLSVPAFAGSEQFRAPALSGLPLGSFESAGVAVFVRAHEARRQLIAPVPSDARPLAYAPVPDRLPIDASGQAAELEIDMPRTTGGTARTRWVAPADQPSRPGALARDPLDAAGPFGKSGLLDLHATPDLEIEVSKRTTLGVFGEANTIEPTDIRNSTVRATRDLGAGVTLQYRFGE